MIVIAVALASFAETLAADDRYAAASAIEINKGYVQERLVRAAWEYLGTPYVYAGTTKKGVDCSGLVYGVYLEATGKKLPRGAGELFDSLTPVRGPLLPGDLVFFDTTGGVSHVGMAIGGSRIIHAASIGKPTGVKISSLEETYYKTRYLGARRVFQYTAPVLYVTLGATRIGTEMAASFDPGRPFTLSVVHKRKGSGQIACRLIRKIGGEKREMKKILIGPGKEINVECSFKEAGAWMISFADSAPGEILRIEVNVERAYAAAAGRKSP
jgi:probable lipoprotein NlpC